MNFSLIPDRLLMHGSGRSKLNASGCWALFCERLATVVLLLSAKGGGNGLGPAV